ncbi:MAG: copper ion binding protein, partial [Halobacteriota archaeon]
MADTTITFKVLGMTCTMCALTIEKQLSDQEGVVRANVNFALGQATITYDPQRIAPKQLAQAIREVGYDVDIERAELEIAGIMCTSCIIAIENDLKKLTGVIDESINPVTAQAVIDYDPSVVTLETIIQTIRNTGYDVIEVPPVGAEAELIDREKAFQARELAQYRNQFIFTIIFGIPLLLGMLA